MTRFVASLLKPRSAFASARAPVPRWGTTPDQLADMLNQFRPASDPLYGVFLEASVDATMAPAVACMNHTAPLGT